MHIAYYTAGDRDFASSRMRAWMVGDALVAMGHEVVFNPAWDYPLDVDAVIVQKRFDLRQTMEIAREAGARVIWDCDDLIPGGPVDLADVVTVSTRQMRTLYPQAVIVPNCLDVPADAPRKIQHADRLRHVVCSVNGANLYHLEYVAQACQQLHLTLTVIVPFHQVKDFQQIPGLHYVDWKRDQVDSQLITHDVTVCSYKINDGEWSAEWVRAKSACRALKAWGLGLPVIGTPIPDYVDNGIQHLATTTEEWVQALTALESREAREQDAERGYALAQEYRAEKVARKWLEVMGESITAG